MLREEADMWRRLTHVYDKRHKILAGLARCMTVGCQCHRRWTGKFKVEYFIRTLHSLARAAFSTLVPSYPPCSTYLILSVGEGFPAPNPNSPNHFLQMHPKLALSRHVNSADAHKTDPTAHLNAHQTQEIPIGPC